MPEYKYLKVATDPLIALYRGFNPLLDIIAITKERVVMVYDGIINIGNLTHQL